MALWTRRKNDYLVKSRKLTDGQLLHYLVSASTSATDDLDERIYESLTGVRESTGKALRWVAASAAFGTLAHFEVLSRVSSSGLEVSSSVFSHVALIAFSASAAIFCFAYCKLTFTQSWFTARFKEGPADRRALYLLKFPEAYWHITFLPAHIGYPKDVFGRKSVWLQVTYVVLIVIALVILAAGSAALWIVMALDVWHSTGISHTVSVFTLILSGAMSLLGWFSPFYYDFSRRYDHYGLVNLLSRLNGNDLEEAHRRIIRVAERMGIEDRTR